jgi:hypothetical protein
MGPFSGLIYTGILLWDEFCDQISGFAKTAVFRDGLYEEISLEAVFRASLFGRQFPVLFVQDIPEECFFGHLSSVLHSSG